MDLLEVDREVRAKTRSAMEKHRLSYGEALRKVLASDRSLNQRYHAAHRNELDALRFAEIGDSGSLGRRVVARDHRTLGRFLGID